MRVYICPARKMLAAIPAAVASSAPHKVWRVFFMFAVKKYILIVYKIVYVQHIIREALSPMLESVPYSR